MDENKLVGRTRSLEERIHRLEVLGLQNIGGLLVLEHLLAELVKDNPTEDKLGLQKRIQKLTTQMLESYNDFI